MITINASGRLGRDAELKHGPTGTPLLKFSIASDGRDGREKVTTWVSCVIFGKRAEALAQYLLKGTAVHVTGEGEINSYTTKDGTHKAEFSIKVSDVAMLGGGKPADAGGRSGGEYDRPSGNGAASEFDDGDVPF